MGHHNNKYIRIRKKRITHIPSPNFLIKKEVNYLVDEIIYKVSLLENKYDENTLHEIRISLRKLKSLIYFFKSFICKDEFSTIKNIIHKLITPTSKVRDYDVVKANYIDPSYVKNNHDNDYNNFLMHSSNEIHNLRQKTLKLLSSQEYVDYLHELKSLSNKYVWKNLSEQNSNNNLGKYIVTDINNKLDKIYTRCKQSYRLPKNELHHLRVKIKEIRYVIEFFKLYIKHYNKILTDLKYLQDTLGKINDTYVAESIIHDLNISKYLSSQHELIEKKILEHRNSNILKLRIQL